VTHLLFAAVPRFVLACSVCFGQSDSPMAQGTNMGILLMLGVTVAMLAAFATFFIYLARRIRMFDDGEPREAHHVPNEGTAQC
jgi:hypothetical protein